MLDDLWWNVRSSETFQALPDWLREPPGLWIALALLALLVLRVLAWLVFGRSRRVRDSDGRLTRSAIRRDLRELKRAGNWLGVGELEEQRGKMRKALAAYRKGDHAEEEVALLVRLDRRAEAKKRAHDAGLWRPLAEMASDDGSHREAAVAYERSGDVYLAGRCYDQADDAIAAARCYVAAGAEAEAVRRLRDLPPTPESAELLDQAIRAALDSTSTSALSLEVGSSVRRAVQAWLSLDESDRAYRLAVDAGDEQLAVWVARDHLPPSEESASLCARAGAHLAAAEIYEALGDERTAALERAEHHLDHGRPEKAAECFERGDEPLLAAEQWAAAGEVDKAADLYESAGDPVTAAQLRGHPIESVRTVPRGASAETSTGERSERSAKSAPIEAGGAVFEEGAPPAGWLGADETDDPSEAPTEAVAVQPESARRDLLSVAEDVLPTDSPDDRYQLLEELGKGGMGVVYRAEDRVLQREVAYKVLPEEMLGVKAAPDLLLAEARAAARLQHPHIVTVYDAGRKGASFFIVMELVTGENFETLLRRRRMSVRGVIAVGRQICSALQHAHERRLVHRDLKPSNLLWSDDRRVKLTDFGLARVLEGTQAQVLTQPAGTPSYMAPEQIRGEAVDPRCDLYAFGCVLYEMLAGRPIFGVGPPSFHHHLSTRPPDPRERRSDVPDELVRIIGDCLEKSPFARPISAAAIGERLAALG